MSQVVVVVYQGKLFRIAKVPFETEEQAHDRAWYIAKHYDSQEHASYQELQCQASKAMYEKHFGMKYECGGK